MSGQLSRGNRLRTGLNTVAVALVLTAATAPLTLAALSTAQIVASAMTPACIQWRVSGICYWLLCTPFGCSVKTSVKVTHNLPEAVVSTYPAPGGNPWREMALVSRTAGGVENAVTGALAGLSAGGGNATEQKNPGQRHASLLFRYADALGHPATSLIGGSISGYSCASAAQPLAPYFLSTLDTLAWRTGLPESLYPEALIPGRRELGSQTGGEMWSALYPRAGLVNQTDADKAAAVVAQRVADIITRTGQPHVYQPLKGTRRPGYWPPGEVTENTGSKNHTWQRLAPQLSRSCAVFPDGSHEAAPDGGAAFALWQPYSCCQRRGQTFLYSNDI
jgi:integrating conjugative element protein (TIGR03756 family)